MLAAVINVTNSMSSLHFRYPILARRITHFKLQLCNHTSPGAAFSFSAGATRTLFTERPGVTIT